MANKWTEKDVLEHARNLKSPYEKKETMVQAKPKLSDALNAMRGNGTRAPIGV